MSTTVIIDSVEGKLLQSDRAAVERAIQFAGKRAVVGRVESVAICCPSGEPVPLRYALAAGAVEIVALDDIPPGLVLFGIGGTGNWGDLLPARLALKHSAHLVLDVLDFQTSDNQISDLQIDVFRDLRRGEKEVLSISLPAVMLMSSAAQAGQYVSRYRQSQVRLPTDIESKRLGSAKIPDSGLSWQPLRRRTRTAEIARKTTGSAQDRMFDTFGLSSIAVTAGALDDSGVIVDVDACVTHFIRYLSHHNLVDLAAPESTLDNCTHETCAAALTAIVGKHYLPTMDSPSYLGVELSEAGHALPQRHCPRPLNTSTEQFFHKRRRQPKAYVTVPL